MNNATDYLCLKALHKKFLSCVFSASPPDVGAYFGFAAGCEARLCLAAKVPMSWGYAPRPACGPQQPGLSPNEGLSPFRKTQLNGEAEPRLTSGGKAAATTLTFCANQCLAF